MQALRALVSPDRERAKVAEYDLSDSEDNDEDNDETEKVPRWDLEPKKMMAEMKDMLSGVHESICDIKTEVAQVKIPGWCGSGNRRRGNGNS